MTRLIRALRDDRGASAVEYALVAVAIAAVIVVIVGVLGLKVKGEFVSTCSAMTFATGSC